MLQYSIPLTTHTTSARYPRSQDAPAHLVRLPSSQKRLNCVCDTWCLRVLLLHLNGLFNLPFLYGCLGKPVSTAKC